jgi:hypothetical protein
MSNVKLNVKMISGSFEEKEYTGSFDNGIISYIEASNMSVQVDLNNRIITREDAEKLLIIDYRHELIHLNLKAFDYRFDMPIKAIIDTLKDNIFHLKYEVEDKIIEYILEYKEI